MPMLPVFLFLRSTIVRTFRFFLRFAVRLHHPNFTYLCTNIVMTNGGRSPLGSVAYRQVAPRVRLIRAKGFLLTLLLRIVR